MTTTRGYILLETVVSGVIIGTAMLGLLVQLGSARVAGVVAARDQTAARLATVELELARSQLATLTVGVMRQEKVRVGNGSYNITTVAEPEALDSMPSPGGLVDLSSRFIRVRTEVSFPVEQSERRIVASTRLYR